MLGAPWGSKSMAGTRVQSGWCAGDGEFGRSISRWVGGGETVTRHVYINAQEDRNIG